MPDGVDIGFLKSAMMEDKYNFLQQELEYYFEETVRVNS